MTRVDVYMNALKSFARKQIYDLDDNDVLDFLIFKDIDNSGRTAVHHKECPHIGTSTFEKCSDKTLCAKRHQAASLRVGIISKLRRGFEDVGGKGFITPLPWKEILPEGPLSVNTWALSEWSREWQGFFLNKQ